MRGGEGGGLKAWTELTVLSLEVKRAHKVGRGSWFLNEAKIRDLGRFRVPDVGKGGGGRRAGLYLLIGKVCKGS